MDPIQSNICCFHLSKCRQKRPNSILRTSILNHTETTIRLHHLLFLGHSGIVGA
ncbi:hypothetical protein GBA52_015694 [Prunus armeniaca]|nr:hypothetical protein GBA52_015694 [Prunus armeniaca]